MNVETERKNLCKHGINSLTCSICLGLPQSEVKVGPPAWLVDDPSLVKDTEVLEGEEEDE